MARDGSGRPNALTGAPGDVPLPPDLRLQILTTEHWSLLSTFGLSWSEAFSRAAMFLSALYLEATPELQNPATAPNRIRKELIVEPYVYQVGGQLRPLRNMTRY